MPRLSPLSVLQVVPALDAGGVERTTIEVAQAIAREGGLALVASRGGRLESTLKSVGGELVRMATDSKNPLTVMGNAMRLTALGKRRRVSIIHARSRAPAWSALWAARRLKTPFVTTYHGVYNARTGLKRFYNSVMARGDVVIANSEYTRSHILDEHDVDPDRVIVIPRGVDLDVFDHALVSPDRVAAMRRAWGIPEERTNAPIVILPARLTRWKGQAVLLEAAAIVERRRPGAAFYVIAGDPQGREEFVSELRNLVGGYGLADVVRIRPHIEDMPAAFLAADIAVFPSTQPEAFGRGAVEAQAMGRPVVVSGVGGMGETIVAGETGLHVPPNAAEALAEALDSLLILPSAARGALGLKGAARVRALYSAEALQTATLGVYRRLLEKQV